MMLGVEAAGGQEGFDPRVNINHTATDLQIQGITYHQFPDIIDYKLDGSEKTMTNESGVTKARATREGDTVVITSRRTFPSPAGEFSVDTKEVYSLVNGMLHVERTETTAARTTKRLARYKKVPPA